MGVKGLWRLLLPIGRRISIETLTGKILAVDASIWLVQFLKAMRDESTGKVTAAAHLIGFFRRICRLRYHGIKPVFVFDGATPEIKKREIMNRRKRREQFASDVGNVQRLARKILADQLLTLTTAAKSKDNMKPTSQKSEDGAFVSGFNPGEQVVNNNNEPEELDRHSNSDANSLKDENAIIASDNDGDAIEIMESAIKSEEGNKQGKPPEINDWEIPLAVAAAEEAREREMEEDDDDEIEYETFNDFSNKLTTTKSYLTENDLFATKEVASLPSAQRKEAVEAAQRKRRLLARKEFMPVAADPLAFSQAQVSNFLKSCRLNKDIVKMSKMAAAQNDHTADVMASDRGTRVELIRETKPEEKSQEYTDYHSNQKVADWSTKKSPQMFHKKMAKVKSKRDDESSSEDDDWEKSGPVKKRRFIDDDDSEYENDNSEKVEAPAKQHFSDDEEENGGGGGLFKCDQNSSKQIISILDDSSDEEAGGFLRDDNEPRNCSGNVQSDHAIAQALQEEEWEASGEYILHHETTTPVSAMDIIGIQDDSSEEQDIAAGFVKCSSNEETKKKINLVAKSSPSSRSGKISDSVFMIQQPTVAENNRSIDHESSDDDEVDWEDGASCQMKENDIGEKSINSADRNVHEFVTNDCNAEDTNKVPSWEDTDPTKEETSASTKKKLVDCNRDKFFDNFPDKHADPNPSDFQEDQSDKPHQNNNPISPETSAALMHAQETAANLTNWAGRAFRRAMMEVTGVSDFPEDGEKPEETVEYVVERSADSTSPQASEHSANLTKGSEEQCENGPKLSYMQFNPTTSAPENFDEEFLRESEAEWAAERNRRERDMDTVSDEMLEEAKQLLQLFGIPYVEAPAEAEAQCAALEELGLVDGCVTEDSDIFVFNGRTVYKNIFEEQKFAEAYLAADAEKEMHLGRNAMIALAMMLGGDYTEGIKGVGIVNAMEILATFDVSQDLKAGLVSFKRWLDGLDPTDSLDEDINGTEKTKRQIFHAKHKRARTSWIAPPDFPSENVMKAYLDPVVDKSKDRFSWDAPDVEKLILFCNRHIGWPPEETKRLLDPVTEQMHRGLRQTRIDSFMKYEDSIKFANIRSKRLREVLGFEQTKDTEEAAARSHTAKSKLRKL
jgi:DNA excision repair protein ERCC-5